MKARIALFANSDKPAAIYWAEYSAKKLKDFDSKVFVTASVAQKFNEEIKSIVEVIELEEFEKFSDFVVTFGGDGTMLSAARVLINGDIPIMGVNVGKLGFLAEFSVNELDEALGSLVKGNYRIVDRAILETTINGETLYAVNEFVIEKTASPKMITVRAEVGEYLIADYRADGIIVTTPTGSTAYSLSCGGPIIAPSTNVICLTPIAPHSLTIRPLVIADSLEITLTLQSAIQHSTIVADGQIERQLNVGDSITIKKSEKDVKIIKHTQTTYFELLRKKLLWSAEGN